MSSGSPPAKSSGGGGGGLSLYADLLDPPTDTSASISRAPQVSQEALEAVKEQDSASVKKPVDPSLRFQPFQSIRRPQLKAQKPKATFPKAAAPPAGGAGAAPGGNGSTAALSAAPAPVKSTLADWAATEDDEWMYAGEKRPRGGKKKKKNRNAPVETNWDEIYDPSRPTNVDEYLRSYEHIQEVREWKALLYKHRRPAKRQASWDSDEDEDRPMTSMCSLLSVSRFSRQIW
jgi:splicing factor 45